MTARQRHGEVAVAKLIEAFITNGAISFNNGVPATERTEEYRDGVTYIDEAKKSVPASFSVAFSVESEFEMPGGGVCQPYISISVPVAMELKRTPFAEIEDAAVVHVVPMLRAIADAVEDQLRSAAEAASEGAVPEA